MPLPENSTFDDILEYFQETIIGSTNLPSWYIPLFKTVAAKNLTISDWNMMFEQLKKNISQTATLVEVMSEFMKIAEQTIANTEIPYSVEEPDNLKEGLVWFNIK
jgi:hypothetical protein